MATAYHKWQEIRRRTLCLSCCKPMEHGYCQACWERESQRAREVVPAGAGEVRRYCRDCGQWRELTAGQCECGTEKR